MDAEGYLARCMVYIDMNMVRAGVVSHPGEWDACGYRELQNPPKRYRILDQPALMSLFNVQDHTALRKAHAGWVKEVLKAGDSRRDENWSESLAVGSEDFVNRIKSALGIKAHYRKVLPQNDDGYLLREVPAPYSGHFGAKMAVLRARNVVFLNEFI